MLARLTMWSIAATAIPAVAFADYSICRSKLDGREYLACFEQCNFPDETVKRGAGGHPTCGQPNGGFMNTGTCGRHWTGWVGTFEFTDTSGNAPCPEGCYRERLIRTGQRSVRILNIQKRDLWQCGGAEVSRPPAAPPSPAAIRAAQDSAAQEKQRREPAETAAQRSFRVKEESGRIPR